MSLPPAVAPSPTTGSPSTPPPTLGSTPPPTPATVLPPSPIFPFNNCSVYEIWRRNERDRIEQLVDERLVGVVQRLKKLEAATFNKIVVEAFKGVSVSKVDQRLGKLESAAIVQKKVVQYFKDLSLNKSVSDLFDAALKFVKKAVASILTYWGIERIYHKYLGIWTGQTSSPHGTDRRHSEGTGGIRWKTW